MSLVVPVYQQISVNVGHFYVVQGMKP